MKPILLSPDGLSKRHRAGPSAADQATETAPGLGRGRMKPRAYSFLLCDPVMQGSLLLGLGALVAETTTTQEF